MVRQNRISLTFADDCYALTGWQEGLSVFYSQIAPNIDYTADIICFIFPDSIRAISSSFIEGLLVKMISTIGLVEVTKKLKIEAENNRISDIFNLCLDGKTRLF